MAKEATANNYTVCLRSQTYFTRCIACLRFLSPKDSIRLDWRDEPLL